VVVITYCIYDMNGYVGDLPNATWVCVLDEYLEEHGGKLLKEFVEEGVVNKSPGLIKELAALPTPKDPAIKGMLKNLVELIEKSQGVVICTYGVSIGMHYLYDAKGCVGELGNGPEVVLLIDYLEKHGGDLLKEFAQEGTVKKSSRLLKEFDRLQVHEDPDVRCMVDNLVALTKKSNKFVTITDGFNNDDRSIDCDRK
jgi:hypothetical protein